MENNQINIPEEYKPISMWGYVGYQLLFTIPCIGFILMCVFAFGGTQNKNLKNYARGILCLSAISVVLVILFYVVVIGLGVLASV